MNQNFISVGTPVDHNHTQQKDLKDNRQQRDERGRVKLRGAFQGAYGAGYYNTVGSKEGWQPSQTTKQSSIYDFMDEDDIKEFGGERYDSLGSTEEELRNRVIGAGLEVVTEIPNGIGSRLLSLMSRTKTFPPAGVVPSPRLTTFGRGYDPLADAPEFKEAKKKVDIRKLLQDDEKSGFGTGIFEEDDEVPLYHVPESNYDFDLDETKLSSSSQAVSSVKKRKHRPGVLDGFIPVERLIDPPKTYLCRIPPPEFVPTPTFKTVKKNFAPSIQNHISKMEKHRLEIANSKAHSVPVEKVQEKGPIPIFTVPAKIAETALKGFMPFGNDIEKQTRYKQFLQSIVEREKAKEEGQEYTERQLSMFEATETREFAKAAMVFQPNHAMITSRFANEGAVTSTNEQKIRVFGKNTRTTTKWKPEKVVCRRFGVAWKQHHDDDDDEGVQDKSILNKDTMEQLVLERDRLLQTGSVPDLVPQEPDHVEVEAIEQEEVELEVEKPSMDLFKAIFADSDGEETTEPPNVTTGINDKSASVGWEPKATIPPENANVVDVPFRPVFTKPQKRESASLNKPRKKKKGITIPSMEAVDVESVDVVKRKVSSDYM